MTKMTDEDLEHELSQALSVSRADKVRAQIAALTAERDEARSLQRTDERDYKASIAGFRAQVDALRERVTALEEAKRQQMLVTAEATQRLVTIRQRAVSLEHVIGKGNVAFLLEDDAPAPSELDGLRGEMAECGACAGANEHQSCAVHPEPTTAEAFATVRRGLDITARGAEPEEMLSLLERRMGAMERVLRMVREAHYPPSDDHAVPGCRCAQCSVRDALTDTPPVFTLEEVREAIAGQGLSDEVDAEILARLTALRR